LFVKIFILVSDQTNKNEYLWSKNKFLNRQIHMQQMYQTFAEMGEMPKVAKVRLLSAEFNSSVTNLVVRA